MQAEIIFSYFPELSEQQKQQISSLYSLYKNWNEKINVISRKDIDELYIRHVLHSLSIAKFTPFLPEANILDVGTGGGFPGIPLAILFPKSQFHLVDSIGKKIKVVKEVAEALKLENLSCAHERAEKTKGRYDFIISRAVARTKLLFQWTHQKFHQENKHSLSNGFILLKGGDLTEELEELKRPYQETGIKNFFTEAFFETKKIIYVPAS
ncbi:MAG: 16S rRNA (guanine(527)-N(7))-methyltransferase RsmG [Bacteroidota bacterium]